MYYKPGEASAYESIKFILNKVHFGWLLRNIHSWSANIMVFFIFIHMFSVFFTKAFKKPREITWISGFLLLVLTLTFGFSGYLLPWNELAFFATKVGTDIISAVPIVGEELKIIVRGGDDVTGATLSRFFGLHVAILPTIFTFLLALHLIMVQRQGMSEPEHFEKQKENEKKYIPFFPDFALRDFLLWLVVLFLILFLAVFFQWELGIKADALAPAPEGIKPEWYFMFMFQTLKVLPSHVLFMEGETFGILFFGVAGFLWMIAPFIKYKEYSFQTPIVNRIFGISSIGFILIMTVIGYLN